MMPSSKPRLLVLGDPPHPAGEAVRSLADRYEIVRTGHATDPMATPAAAPAPAPGAMVLIDLASFLALQRTAADAQAAAVLESIGEGVCVVAPDGRVVWSNDRFRAYDEQTRARIVSVCVSAAGRFQGGLPAPGPTMSAAAGINPGKLEVASADGSAYYEVAVTPVRHGAAPGTEGLVAAVAWDVTASRRVRLKMEAIDSAGRELVRLDADSIRKMHVGDRLRLLEEKIIKFAHDLMRFDHFTIRLLDVPTGKLELVIASGLPAAALEVDLYSAREGSGISGFVASTGASYLCANVRTDRRYVQGLTDARSSLTVPLRLHDRVIGVFNVESDRPGAFTEEDRGFAEMFANHVALALHILDLLVVERCATGENVTGAVQGELSAPLEDILKEADWLKQATALSPDLRRHVEQIAADVEAIRARVRDAAAGPQNILGAERAMHNVTADPRLAGKRVLVADDEPRMRQIIRDVLGNRGCRTVVCENGAQAIVQLEAAAAKGQRFDLVLSDIKMPDRNGYEVFAAAKRLDPALPVILITGFGYDPHHSIVRASQEGLQCVLFKPFQVERLLEEVYKALTPVGDI